VDVYLLTYFSAAMQFFNPASVFKSTRSSLRSTEPRAGRGADAGAVSDARPVAVSLPESRVDELPPGLRIVCISDTHGKHDKIDAAIPLGDVLIHAGDFSDTGHVKGVTAFAEWFDNQPHSQKIFIAGNHDTTLHTEYYVKSGAARFHSTPKMRGDLDPAAYSALCRGVVHGTRSCTYLEDSATELAGCGAGQRPPADGAAPSPAPGPVHIPLLVYGSPWQPEFCDWAFNLQRGPPCLTTWQKIPIETDVLITHGPPYGYGDRTTSGFKCGCTDMTAILKGREKKPRVHIFGHIHEDYGTTDVRCFLID
jgi:predicted phosphohydrolase